MAAATLKARKAAPPPPPRPAAVKRPVAGPTPTVRRRPTGPSVAAPPGPVQAAPKPPSPEPSCYYGGPEAPPPPPPRSPAPPAAPASPPAPPPSTAEQLAVAARMADALEAFVFPRDAAAAFGLEPGADDDRRAVRMHLARVWNGAADPHDPVEQMLLAQMTVAHHRAAALHARAVNAGSDAADAVLTASAARLTAEVTRAADALARYRHVEAARGRYAKPKPAHRTGK
jgi:hypothetical protein